MNKLASALLACGLAIGATAPLAAQDLTITNAHIVVGNGTVIERGSIVVRGGKIVSVAAGAPASTSGQVIDAKGMSAMAGFIDAHRHINTGPEEKAQMQRQLEAGYTTILSGGGPGDGNLTLREHIETGVINGPRVIPSERLRLAGTTPEAGREAVRTDEGGGHRLHRRDLADARARSERRKSSRRCAPCSTKARRSASTCRCTP